MKKIAGAILIGFGLIAIGYGAVTYTTKETVVDIGPIKATRDKEQTIPLPPIAGAAALVGGVALVAAGRKE
ncbi:MAG: DUF3185 domain-containing protein [Acidobacteriota bacterium]